MPILDTEQLDREDALILLGSVPERLADLVAGFDENFLRYRHGPAFPNLLELATHLSRAGSGVDALMRAIQIDGQERLDVRRTIDPAGEPANDLPPMAQQLEDFARIRRRTIDLLRGVDGEGWERLLADHNLGEVTLLDVVQVITRHELGHLTQVRNLIAVLPEAEDLGPAPIES